MTGYVSLHYQRSAALGKRVKSASQCKWPGTDRNKINDSARFWLGRQDSHPERTQQAVPLKSLCLHALQLRAHTELIRSCVQRQGLIPLLHKGSQQPKNRVGGPPFRSRLCMRFRRQSASSRHWVPAPKPTFRHQMHGRHQCLKQRSQCRGKNCRCGLS